MFTVCSKSLHRTDSFLQKYLCLYHMQFFVIQHLEFCAVNREFGVALFMQNTSLQECTISILSKINILLSCSHISDVIWEFRSIYTIYYNRMPVANPHFLCILTKLISRYRANTPTLYCEGIQQRQDLITHNEPPIPTRVADKVWSRRLSRT